MVNKLTIETMYKRDPYKTYYVIKNPKINKDKKKVYGLKNKIVEYKVLDWDNKVVNFKKVNDNNKSYPEIISFDKRYPDAENEVLVETKKKKTTKIDTMGIFTDPLMARYHKLIRLHRLAESMQGLYVSLKNQKDNQPTAENKKNKKKTDSDDSKGNVIASEAEQEIKEGVVVKKDLLKLKDVKNYFKQIQDTNYFDELEEIQANNPSLATK